MFMSKCPLQPQLNAIIIIGDLFEDFQCVEKNIVALWATLMKLCVGTCPQHKYPPSACLHWKEVLFQSKAIVTFVSCKCNNTLISDLSFSCDALQIYCYFMKY